MLSSILHNSLITGFMRVRRTTDGDGLVWIGQSNKGREQSEKNVETR